MRPPARQRGFSLVAAIFVVVVLAAAAVYMARIAGVQRSAGLLALQGARAFHAARSGLEWGIARYEALAACPSPAPAPEAIAFTGPGLAGFTATVSLVACSEHQEGAGPARPVIRIAATGELGSFGDADYVYRRLQATVMPAP